MLSDWAARWRTHSGDFQLFPGENTSTPPRADAIETLWTQMSCSSSGLTFFYLPSAQSHRSHPLSASALRVSRASLVVQMIKSLPAMQETQVRSLDWEDPLEKGTATLSSILAWRIPLTEEPGGLQSMGVTESQS